MSALAEALLAAQRSALAAMQRAYLAGALDETDVPTLMDSIGCTDKIEQGQYLVALETLRGFGVQTPATNGHAERGEARERRTMEADPQARGRTRTGSTERAAHARAGVPGDRGTESAGRVMPRKNPPRLVLGPLSGRVYIATRYTERPDGVIETQEKYDVTNEFFALYDEAVAKFTYKETTGAGRDHG